MSASMSFLLQDFAPREVLLTVNPRTPCGVRGELAFARLATEECVYFALGRALVRKVSRLCLLRCECPLGGGTCEMCERSSLVEEKETTFTEEELLDALKWMDVRTCLENSKLGRSVDGEWVELFLRDEWTASTAFGLFLVGSRLEPYLLPINRGADAALRLAGRLKRLAEHPAETDDAEKTLEVDTSSV